MSVYYRYIIEKMTSTEQQMSEQQTLRRACPTKWRETADMKKLRHCHPMYTHL